MVCQLATTGVTEQVALSPLAVGQNCLYVWYPNLWWNHYGIRTVVAKIPNGESELTPLTTGLSLLTLPNENWGSGSDLRIVGQFATKSSPAIPSPRGPRLSQITDVPVQVCQGEGRKAHLAGWQLAISELGKQLGSKLQKNGWGWWSCFSEYGWEWV